MEVYKILCRYYILHIVSFGSLLVFFCPSFAQHGDEIECPYHLNFYFGRLGGGGEGGWYGWFGFCKNFFPQTSGDTIIIIVRFFPALYAMKSIFFQCRNFFRQAFPYKKCISLEQSVGNFSLKWPIPPSPLKSQMVSPLQEINCLNMASKTVSFSVFKKSLIIHKEKKQKKLMLNVCP